MISLCNIIGAGRIGKVHDKTIGANPKAKLAYIADAVPKAAADLAALYGAKVASVDEIMRAKDVDAVLIGSPTGFHAEQIQKASNAGKAIMCEKPVPLEVKTISAGLAPMSRATSARAWSRAARACWPNQCRLEALPKPSRRTGSMASSTRGSTGVVALWSR